MPRSARTERCSRRADGVHRHPTDERCYEVRTRYGRSIRVTGHHSIFVEGVTASPRRSPSRSSRSATTSRSPGGSTCPSATAATSRCSRSGAAPSSTHGTCSSKSQVSARSRGSIAATCSVCSSARSQQGRTRNHLRAADAPARRPRDPDVPAPGARRPADHGLRRRRPDALVLLRRRPDPRASSRSPSPASTIPVNIGNPDEFTLLELAEAVIEVTGSRLGDRLRGAADRRPQAAPARHHARPRAARLGAEGRAARGPAAHDRRGRRRGAGGRGAVERCTVTTRASGASAVRSGEMPTRAAHRASRVPRARRPRRAAAGPRRSPSATCAASARRRCRSCCAWTRCAALARVVSLLALDFARRLRGDRSPRWGSRRRRADASTLSRLRRPGQGLRRRSPSSSPCCCSRGSGLYADRARAPGPAAHRRLALPGRRSWRCSSRSSTASSSRATTSSTARCSSASPTSSTLRWVYERLTGGLLRAAGYQRRAVLVGTGEHIEAVAHALRRRRGTPIDVVGFVSLDAAARQRAALAGRAGRPRATSSSTTASTRSSSPTPTSRSREAVELVDAVPPARRRRAHRAVDDGDPRSTAPSSCPGSRCRCSSSSRRSSRASTTRSSARSTSSASLAAARRCSARLLALDRARRQADLARAGRLPLDAPGHRRRAVRVPEVPHDVPRRRRSARPTSRSTTRPTGALFKIRDDPRLTPVGRFLRRFSLDELPQLFNVVRGEMSLVGPRPLPQRDYERLEDWHRKRYLVLPGITGLWQVSGRSELDFDDLVRLDFLYLERWSVFLDLSILRQDDARRAHAAGRVLASAARSSSTAASATRRCRRAQPGGRARHYAGAPWSPGARRSGERCPRTPSPSASPRAARSCSPTRAAGQRVLDLGCGDGRFAAELRGGGRARRRRPTSRSEALRRARARGAGAPSCARRGRAAAASPRTRSTSSGPARCSSTSPTSSACWPRCGACCAWGGTLLVTTPWHWRVVVALRAPLRPALGPPALLQRADAARGAGAARLRRPSTCARAGARRAALHAVAR